MPVRMRRSTVVHPGGTVIQPQAEVDGKRTDAALGEHPLQTGYDFHATVCQGTVRHQHHRTCCPFRTGLLEAGIQRDPFMFQGNLAGPRGGNQCECQD